MRPLQLLTALALVLALVACQSPSSGGGESASVSNRLERMLKTGELRVGLTGDQAPLNMRNKSGEIIGLEADVVQALADSMGLELRYVVMPFAELIPALESEKVDMVISGMTITAERNTRVAFVGPYFISGKTVLTKSEEIAAFESAAQADTADRTYAALAGSTSEAFIRDVLPTAKLVTTVDFDSGVKMVIDDEVDALVADFQTCVVALWRNPDAGFQDLMMPFTIEPLGIALPANAPLLANLVENYLDALEATGLLTQYKARWLGDGSWLAELP
jgi:polar amino acid transport system substrate-binding protein